MIRCPNCGATHYSTGEPLRTAARKDGVNINPDMNTTTTQAHCSVCHHDFKIKEQGSRIWTELGRYNPPDELPMPDNEAVPLKAKTAVATIDISKRVGMRTRFNWEIDIEKLQEEVKVLRKEISDLRQALIIALEALK